MKRWHVVGILASVAASLTYLYVDQLAETADAALSLQLEIIGGVAPSPYRYRLLVPLLLEGLRSVFASWLPPASAWTAAMAVYTLVATFGAFSVLYRLLREWYTTEQALIGILGAATLAPIALRDHYYQPWTLVEIAVMALAVLLTLRRHWFLLATTVVVASLNRETALFIPLIVCLMCWGNWEDMTRAVALGIIWMLIYGGLRLLQGSAPHVMTLVETWEWNTKPEALRQVALHVPLFLGVFWAFAAAGVKLLPSELRRAWFVVVPYTVALILFGVWYEVRLLMPLYGLFLPAALATLYQHTKNPV